MYLYMYIYIKRERERERESEREIVYIYIYIYIYTHHFGQHSAKSQKEPPQSSTNSSFLVSCSDMLNAANDEYRVLLKRMSATKVYPKAQSKRNAQCGMSSMAVVSSHDLDSQKFDSRVSNPMSKYVGAFVKPW